MKQRKIPLRKSVVSGEMKPKKEMVRITRSKEGEVSIDPTGKMPGRGAYVSLEPEEVQQAGRRRDLPGLPAASAEKPAIPLPGLEQEHDPGGGPGHPGPLRPAAGV